MSVLKPREWNYQNSCPGLSGSIVGAGMWFQDIQSFCLLTYEIRVVLKINTIHLGEGQDTHKINFHRKKCQLNLSKFPLSGVEDLPYNELWGDKF